MQLKVVLVGSVVIILSFGAFFWFMLKGRQESLQNAQFSVPQQQQPVTTFNDKSTFDRLEPSKQKQIAAEGEVGTYLLRGDVISYDSTTKTASVISDKTPTDPIELLYDVDLSQVAQVTCWPEFMTLSDGQQIPLEESFIPIEPNKKPFLEGQTVKNFTEVVGSIQSKYTFIQTTNKDPNQAVIPTNVILLGC